MLFSNFNLEENKFYKIETVNNKYSGYVLSSSEKVIKLLYEEYNLETFDNENCTLGNAVKVPQIVMIAVEHIVTAQRVYQKDEYKKYYIPHNITKLYIPQAVYLSDEQKKYELSTLFDTIEQCQLKCDELNNAKGWKTEDLTYIEFSNESKEAIKEALEKEKEEEKKDDKQN